MEEITLAAVLSLFVIVSMSLAIGAAFYYFILRIRAANALRATAETVAKIAATRKDAEIQPSLNQAIDALFAARDKRDVAALNSAFESLRTFRDQELQSQLESQSRNPAASGIFEKMPPPHSEIGL
ncbi:MAG: hypothetical protein A2X94_00215 [Bdellovibrionales bacterium GWB1_55_8]|nr:MAG: hypothetical protein A2X94_00215 [Bdellovibrionales bacterium GWB1_55_8]